MIAIKQFRPHLIVIGLYAVLTSILTWPLVANISTLMPGEASWAFDESTFIWNMWWFKFSLLELNQSPLISTYTFFPLNLNLTTYTFNLFNAAFSLPLQLSLSLPLASNLTLLFSYISSAYGMFLLSLYLLNGNPKNIKYKAAFIAGAVFAFSASRMMYVALGHYNFVTIQWFPFYTLFLLKTIRDNSSKNILLTGFFAACAIYAELTYSVFLLFITLIVLAGEWINIHAFLRMSTRLLAVSLVTLLLTAPFILSVLPDFLNPAFVKEGWGEGLKLSADLAGLFTLTPLHPLSGLNWPDELRAVIEGNSRFNDANTLFLGYGILAMALLGYAVRRKKGQVWLWAVIIFAVLSLGPLLTINGQNRFNLDGIDVTFPMPFTLLHYLPIINANRVPNRFGIPLTMAMAVLVGYGVVWLLGKIGAKKRNWGEYLVFISSFLILTLLLFDQYSPPLPMTYARIPELYQQIGAEQDDFTIMQLPLGWRNSYGTLGAERTQLQYYQSAHKKPMLGGNSSRNPSFKFDYYANIPLFEAITEAELYRSVDEEILQKAREQAAELMTLYNIKYLVVHDPIPNRVPYADTFQNTANLAFDLIPHQTEPVYSSDGVRAFAVKQAPIPNPFIIDFGEWTATPYRGEGWAGDEEIFAATANWATQNETVIFFPAKGGGNRTLSLHIAPFAYPDMPKQTVNIFLNGFPVGQDYPLHEGWQLLKTTLLEKNLKNGLNRLTLHFAHTAQPRQVIPSNKMIGQSGIETPTDLELNSGADFAFITVGFGDETVDASAHRRGVNIAVIHPQSGQLIDSKGFDTAANRFEAAALSEYIAAIPDGQIILLATQGLDATAYFDDNLFAALQSSGLTTDRLRPPFSAIGVKGTAPGSAMQSGSDSAYLRLGAIPDSRNLAVAVDKVIISR